MLTEDQRTGLGVALNEANLLGFEVNQEKRIAAAAFSVLTLPEIGPPPPDRRVQVVFRPVGRVAASLRNGRWDDTTAEAVPFAVQDLLGTVQSFGGLAVYGWDFIDVHDRELRKWGNRLSLDWTSGLDGLSHSLWVFQDGAGNRILELCVWFDELAIRDSSGIVVSLESLIAGGKRWWDAFNTGDDRTKGFGPIPLKGPSGH